ncbi:hypothetical protein [Defluviimonas sp. SAOS-178_SWC]|uniref:hypothetical protein n=1 Tax=Defluviimonas sp. SAOS-178_SWC TaxID=3121287 RepID=UPI003221CFEA
MAERNGTARSRGAEDPGRQDALEYWYMQEMTPLDGADHTSEPPDRATEDRDMVSGWWILPVLLLAIPAWVGLANMLF